MCVELEGEVLIMRRLCEIKRAVQILSSATQRCIVCIHTTVCMSLAVHRECNVSTVTMEISHL